MTISTTTSKVTHAGNGATTVFSFPFVGVSEDDLVVKYVNAVGSVVTLSPSLYTVAINSTPVGGLWGIGGFITYPNTGSPPTPIATGTSLTIERDVPYEQTVSISNQGAFYPQAVEQGLDLLELQIQQLGTDYTYAFKAPVTDVTPPVDLPSAELRADGYFTFDSNGQPTVTFDTPGSLGPSTFGNPRKVIVSGTSTVTLTEADSWAGVSIYQASGANTTVQLPTTGGPYPVFDGGLTATADPITVVPGSGTILGAANFVLRYNGSSATFYLDGTTVLVG